MTITVVFDPPLPSDSTATFNTKAFATLGDLNVWSTEANALATDANTDAATATTQAGTATTQAGIATTQADTATTQAGIATTGANTATTQAGIATTKAGEALTSANNAAASAAAAAISAGSVTPLETQTLAAASKATPVDADLIPIVDSAASNVLKKLTWANLKATIPDAVGFRNRIINGDMRIDQRNAGAAQTITAAAALAYTVDRFYAYCTGANVTGQQVAGSSQSQKRYQFTGAASVTAIGFGTRLEARNTYDLNSQTVTISADLANSLLTTVTWTLFRATTTDDTFGTLASPTVTQVATGTFTVNSTVTRYSAQVAVTAASTTGLQLVLSVGAQTSGTWTIGNVQLELGSTATTFEQRPYGVELALCQRYYYRTAPTVNGPFGTSANVSTTLTDATMPLPVRMRIAPTSLEQSGAAGDYGMSYASTIGTCTSVPTFASSTSDSVRTRFTIGAVLTVGWASIPYAVNTNGYLAWSAEL